MAWFIKTETFRLPRQQLLPHLRAHHQWVAELRAQGVVISSGYLVDQAGRPGGGGLLLLAAEDYAAAEALVRQDPLIANGCVDWQLQGWIAAVGDLAVAPGQGPGNHANKGPGKG
ncbi:MAG: YciI family protein [Cyanobacteria bacterium]|nr:YciI family protein [Cyanobacteriota bacterium]